MKTLLSYCLVLFLFNTSSVWAQSSLDGGWKLSSVNGQPLVGIETVAILQDGYFMFGQYQSDGSFVSAGGGGYELADDQLNILYDFFTEDASQVRSPIVYAAQVTNNQLTLKDTPDGTQVWERLGEETTPLTGAWRFATRVDEDGNEGERRRAGPRITVKILSGSRFQWAAFNYATKEFMGTGGGTYQATEDGEYTENIEFFSRDDSRTGASLSFEYRRTADDWYHKGLNSKGEPMHEVWTEGVEN
ncbi:hypothetical protein [Tunicatimonas pelagia]|uniref:hypothetical protein n=1 Tax=Tunicatimonas pelagia TaxID=931531 RepID=UPI002666B5D3|nr:hypothetical protein [Tunicatimonas pelagia]WKN41538.1 hypothetical protein P0M28_21110 [Tunicatimonas pelagia]